MNTWKKALICSLTPLFLAGCQLNIQKAPLQGENQAKFYLQLIARGQEAYYRANGQFSSSADKLALDFNLDTPDYRYTIVARGQKAQTAIVTAQAKKEGLRSYTGIMGVTATGQEVKALVNACQTEQPSTIPPMLSENPPPGQALTCPPGSIPINL